MFWIHLLSYLGVTLTIKCLVDLNVSGLCGMCRELCVCLVPGVRCVCVLVFKCVLIKKNFLYLRKFFLFYSTFLIL